MFVTAHADNLHTDGASTANDTTARDILPYRPCQCNGVDTGMVVKPLVLKCGDAGGKFFRHFVRGREAPLAVGSNGCGKQVAGSIFDDEGRRGVE